METTEKFKQVYQPSEAVVAREVQGEFLLIPVMAGTEKEEEDAIFTLNETGRAIWKKLDGKTSLETITSLLAQEFEGDPSEISRDVLGLSGELLKRRMIVEVTGG